MKNHFRCACVLSLMIFGLGCASLSARTMSITQVDLFSLKRWNSTQVSVYGLRLGMTLEEATAVLSGTGLSLSDVAARTSCGRASRFCEVDLSNGATEDGTDVEVQFGKGDRISIIDIGSPLINPMGFPRNPATVTANSFMGMPWRFFFHYSDELRLRLLGPPDRVKKSPTTDAMQGQIYYYDRLGLIVGTSRSLMRGMKKPTPPELSGIEFVMPKAPRANRSQAGADR